MNAVNAVAIFTANSSTYSVRCRNAAEASAVTAAAAKYADAQTALQARYNAGEITLAQLSDLDSEAWDSTVGTLI